MDMPATIYVALGAVLAALIAGFFSFLNLVSSKENKVSEFRLNWIDGIRTDIAEFTSGIHELVRVKGVEKDLSPLEWLNAATEPYKKAREAITKIQLRLNPQHVKDDPHGLDAKLMEAVVAARKSFNEGDTGKTAELIDAVRAAAAPLLKKEWERVKRGEPTYRRVRTIAWVSILIGVVFILAIPAYLLLHAVSGS
jgi:hypothetical protein